MQTVPFSFLTRAAMVAMIIAAGLSPAAADEGKSAGDFMVRARAILVAPDESGTVGTIGGSPQATNEPAPEVDFTYFLTDHIGLELIAATTRHKVTVERSALGNVALGSVRALPPTLTVQYHLLPKAVFSPYIGAGLNWTLFFDAHLPKAVVTAIDYSNSVGPALQAGADIRLAPNVYLNVDVKKVWIDTDVSVNNGAINAHANINPWILGIGVGYKF